MERILLTTTVAAYYYYYGYAVSETMARYVQQGAKSSFATTCVIGENSLSEVCYLMLMTAYDML